MYYAPVRHVFNIRLACVKYIASVHPEPGSNSLKGTDWLYKIYKSEI